MRVLPTCNITPKLPKVHSNLVPEHQPTEPAADRKKKTIYDSGNPLKILI